MDCQRAFGTWIASVQMAKAKAPCIVFVDEIDAIGSNRQCFASRS